MSGRPVVIGIGGTVRPVSTTERALEIALESAERAGAEAIRFTGPRLTELPHYSPAEPARCDAALELVEAVRHADGVIVASPGYHASVSGLVKNALDYLEDLRDDERPYLQRRSVGCIATGAGRQATVSTLAALRSIVHALRGWPTPLGAAVVTDDGGDWAALHRAHLETVGAEVVEFATLQRATVRG